MTIRDTINKLTHFRGALAARMLKNTIEKTNGKRTNLVAEFEAIKGSINTMAQTPKEVIKAGKTPLSNKNRDTLAKYLQNRYANTIRNIISVIKGLKKLTALDSLGDIPDSALKTPSPSKIAALETAIQILNISIKEVKNAAAALKDIRKETKTESIKNAMEKLGAAYNELNHYTQKIKSIHLGLNYNKEMIKTPAQRAA